MPRATAAIALLVVLLLTADAPASVAGTARMWDVVPSRDWEIQVRSIERLPGPLRWSARGDSTRPRGRFALIVLDLANRSRAPRRPAARDFELQAATGQDVLNRSQTKDAAAHATLHALARFGSTIAPGEQVTTLLIFDIDPRASNLTLTFRPAPHRPIRLDECHCSLPLPAAKGSAPRHIGGGGTNGPNGRTGRFHPVATVAPARG